MTIPVPIRGVVFDFHETLVTARDPGAWVEAAWRHLGRDASPAAALGPEGFERVRTGIAQVWRHAAVIDPDGGRDLDPGRHRAVFQQVMELSGVEEDLGTALYAVMTRQWVPFDDVLPVLAALREREVATLVLSNVGIDIRDHLDRAGIAALVDDVVLSFEVGVVKPRPEIFARALARLRLPADEVLMVGDNARDDTGGVALGIRTLILPPVTGPVRGLAAVLGLVDGAATGRAGVCGAGVDGAEADGAGADGAATGRAGSSGAATGWARVDAGTR